MEDVENWVTKLLAVLLDYIDSHLDRVFGHLRMLVFRESVDEQLHDRVDVVGFDEAGVQLQEVW